MHTRHGRLATILNTQIHKSPPLLSFLTLPFVGDNENSSLKVILIYKCVCIYYIYTYICIKS